MTHQPVSSSRKRTFPCEEDATSVRGLAQYRRLHVEHWADLLLMGCKHLYSVHRATSLREWLMMGAVGDLIPRGTADTSFVARRASARRWKAYCGVRIEEINEACLVQIINRRLAAEGKASSTFRRDCAYLRRWVRLAQRSLNMQPRVARRGKGGPSVVPKRSRLLWSLEEIAALLTSAPALVRAMIGLALGGRLTTAEISRVMYEHIGPDYAYVEVIRGSRRGRPTSGCARRVALPAWVRDLLRQALGDTPPLTGLCFPSRRGKRRTKLDGVLWRLTKKLGTPVPTFEALRRVGQAIARGYDASRITVRGVVRAAAAGTTREAAVFARQQGVLAERWVRMQEPPCAPTSIPARAPKRCAPVEPELDRARKEIRARFVAELPASCGPQRPVSSTSIAVVESNDDEDAADMLQEALERARRAEAKIEELQVKLATPAVRPAEFVAHPAANAPFVPSSTSDLVGMGLLGAIGGVFVGASLSADPTAPPAGSARHLRLEPP